MSSKESSKPIVERFGFNPEHIEGKVIDGYRIDRCIGHGLSGVAFYAVNSIDVEAMCKVLPEVNLAPNWKEELDKLAKLENIPQVVQYKCHYVEKVDGINCVFILYEFVQGTDLQKYLQNCPNVTVGFVELLLSEILNVLQAMKVTGITHGNINSNNIIIADKDPRFISQSTRIKLTDFGIKTCNNVKPPSDDYQSLAQVCSTILKRNIDPAMLEGEDRFVRDKLLTVFLEKQLAEDNVTMGDFVRNPIKLLEILRGIRNEYDQLDKTGARSKLSHPFDYLSCEHFGDSSELLQKLYSKHFPGYQELNRKINTILTGPRGCGKTTIFKNLSLKTQLQGHHPAVPEDFVGVYYHCIELSFAFPYKIEKLSVSVQKTITHFFNLSILCEILDTLKTAEQRNLNIPTTAVEKLQNFLVGWLPSCQTCPEGIAGLRQLFSLAVGAKESFRESIDRYGLEIETWPSELRSNKLLQQDFLLKFCTVVRSEISWLNNLPFYIFLDDYSAPKVSREVQYTLHNFILNRYSELFFKISTDSVVTFIPRDAKGRLCEEGREYEIIDLGEYFLHASSELKQTFLAGIVNNRLENAQEFEWDCRSINDLLGNSPYRTSIDLAEAIKKSEKVHYAGWSMIVNLCSGDIANILRLIQRIFSISKLKGEEGTPISIEIQDQAIRETASEFFEKLKAIPGTGPRICDVVHAFGEVAHHYLMNRRSRNVDKNPPYQAFRLELLETPDLEEQHQYKSLAREQDDKIDISRVYEDLIRYGAFFRDVKGKSQRGAVVPRLYLRRLLIPTFLLTPSKRDHIRVNADEFKMLLNSPDKFKTHMIGKPFRDELPSPHQRRLNR